jgi:hypothetical protein
MKRPYPKLYNYLSLLSATEPKNSQIAICFTKIIIKMQAFNMLFLLQKTWPS